MPPLGWGLWYRMSWTAPLGPGRKGSFFPRMQKPGVGNSIKAWQQPEKGPQDADQGAGSFSGGSVSPSQSCCGQPWTGRRPRQAPAPQGNRKTSKELLRLVRLLQEAAYHGLARVRPACGPPQSAGNRDPGVRRMGKLPRCPGVASTLLSRGWTGQWPQVGGARNHLISAVPVPVPCHAERKPSLPAGFYADL